jgi:hypothetical protein
MTDNLAQVFITGLTTTVLTHKIKVSFKRTTTPLTLGRLMLLADFLSLCFSSIIK